MSCIRNRLKRILLITPILLVFIGPMGCAGSSSNGYSSGKHYPSVRSTGSPEGGGFTIVLAQYDFQDRSDNAQALIQRAKKILNTDDVWLINEPQGLSVNYGRWDRNTSQKKLEQELIRVKQVYPTLQPGAYQFCFIREIPEPDPPAPTEWNLLNQNCRYSLEVATYYDVPEKNYFNRKADAVRAVENLRKDGDPAFFIHGRKESHVYIGCLPENVNPTFVRLIQKKYPHHHENGAVLYDIHYDVKGKKLRVAHETAVIDLELLRQGIPF